MSVPTRTDENEIWYTRPGRRRPHRVVKDDGTGTPTAPPGTSGAEGVARERSEANPPSKRSRRPREGRGEGENDVQADELPEGEPPF